MYVIPDDFVLYVLAQVSRYPHTSSQVTVVLTERLSEQRFFGTDIREIQSRHALHKHFHWIHTVGEAQIPIPIKRPAASATWCAP